MGGEGRKQVCVRIRKEQGCKQKRWETERRFIRKPCLVAWCLHVLRSKSLPKSLGFVTRKKKKKKKQQRMMPVWTLIALTYPEKQRNYWSRDELFLCILKQGWVQLCAWQGREFDNSIQPQSYSSQTSANRWKSWWWLLCPGTLLALGGGGGISSLELGGKGSQKSSQLLAPLPRCALPAACSTLTHKELL